MSDDGCGTCRARVVNAGGWVLDIIGTFTWPMPVGDPVTLSGHIVVCTPCCDLIVAGRVGDLVRRGFAGKRTNAAVSEMVAMTNKLLDQLDQPVRLEEWARQHPDPGGGTVPAPP